MTENPLIGRVVGDYRIESLIGQGGMGSVYEAEQISLGRRVALKTLKNPAGESGSLNERFRREAEAAARLNHPNIVSVYAQGQEGDFIYYAMELIRGETLDRLLDRLRMDPDSIRPASVDLHAPTVRMAPDAPSVTPKPTPRALDVKSTPPDMPGQEWITKAVHYVAEAAGALAYAHLSGVLHRDIKPSNLILSESGHIKITDFGLAGLLDAPGLTMTGEIMGTPAYMSPEQAQGRAHGIDERSDVYSLGVTLYEMTTLRLPFSGQGAFEIIHDIVSQEPESPRNLNPKIPKDLETIILKMMEKEPARRYQSAAEAAVDLRRFLEGDSILARPIGPAGRLYRYTRRRKAAVGLVAAIPLIVLLGAGVVRMRKLQQANATAEQTRLLDETVSGLIASAGEKIQSGRVVEAFADLDQALSLEPGGAQALDLRARLLYASEEYGEAIEDLNRLLQIEPRNAAALYLRSAARRKREEFEQADLDAERAAELSPDTPEAFFSMAEVQRISGEIAQAISALDHALGLDPAYFDALIERGKLHFENRNLSLAQNDFQQASAMRPGHPAAASYLADILWRQGKRQQSFAMLEAALENAESADAATWAMLGELHRREGRWSPSIEALEKAIEIEPDDMQWRLRLAEAQYMAGDFAGAVESLSEPIESQPDSLELSERLILIHFRMGLNPEAARDAAYKQVIELAERGFDEKPLSRMSWGERQGAAAGRKGSPGKGRGSKGAREESEAGARRGQRFLDEQDHRLIAEPLILSRVALNFDDSAGAIQHAKQSVAAIEALGGETGDDFFGMRGRARMALAQAFRSAGLFSEATENIQLALSRNPDLVFRGRGELQFIENAVAQGRQFVRELDTGGTRPMLFPGRNRARNAGSLANQEWGARMSGEKGAAQRPQRRENQKGGRGGPGSPGANGGGPRGGKGRPDPLEQASQKVEQSPDEAEGWLKLAQLQFSDGDTSEAQSNLEKAMALDSLLAEPYRLRGLVRLQTGNKTGALDDLMRAWALDPDVPTGLGETLQLLYEADRVDEAERLYDQAAFRFAHQPRAHSILGASSPERPIRPEMAEFYKSRARPSSAGARTPAGNRTARTPPGEQP